MAKPAGLGASRAVCYDAEISPRRGEGNQGSLMQLTDDERELLSYLRIHCPSADQAGGLPLDRRWTSAQDARKTHSRALAGLLRCDSAQLEALTERLRDRGLAGFTRTGTSFCLWATEAGRHAVAPQPG